MFTNWSFFVFTGSRYGQRRKRTNFTNKQLNRLEEVFEENRFPGIEDRERLTAELGIREDRIQVLMNLFLFYGISMFELVNFLVSKWMINLPKDSFSKQTWVRTRYMKQKLILGLLTSD